jgi:sugar phosphate isomerase/epimerase
MKDCVICDDGRLELALPTAERYGLGVEVQAFYDPLLTERDPSAISSHHERLSRIRLRASHGCFGDLCPGSFDPMVRGVARHRFDLSYGIARELGATHLVLHHGYVPHTSPPDRWLMRCAAFWKEFLAGMTDDIAIHIENVLEWEPGLLSDLIDAIGMPIVDVNLDVGHVQCNSRTPLEEWIRRLGRRIGYAHLHDNHGTEDEHLSLGKGSIPLNEALTQLEEAAPNAIWAVESDIERVEESIQWLIENGFGRALERA